MHGVAPSFCFLPKLTWVVGYGKSRDPNLAFLQEYMQNGRDSGTKAV